MVLNGLARSKDTCPFPIPVPVYTGLRSKRWLFPPRNGERGPKDIRPWFVFDQRRLMTVVIHGGSMAHVNDAPQIDSWDAATDKPQFIDLDVWRRARYYSPTRKAIQLLETAFDRQIYLIELARAARMERTAFSKLFRKKTGTTLRQFIQAYRVSHAAAQLENSDHSITEIAYNVGFGSLDTFERVFKSVVGATPSSYRLDRRRENGLIPILTGRRDE